MGPNITICEFNVIHQIITLIYINQGLSKPTDDPSIPPDQFSNITIRTDSKENQEASTIIWKSKVYGIYIYAKIWYHKRGR